MENNDNNYLILGLASPSNMETSENQMNGHSGPNQIPEGENSNDFENESVNRINILENEKENSQPSQKEDVQPSRSNEEHIHKSSFCRCSAIVMVNIE